MERNSKKLKELFRLFADNPSLWVRLVTKFKKVSFAKVLKHSYLSGRRHGYQQGIACPREITINADSSKLIPEIQPDHSIYGPGKLPVSEELRRQMMEDTRNASNSGVVSMPTEDQWKMILSDYPASSVIAGAGSGKSTTLVLRVVFMVCYLKIDIREIKVISFTRASCVELREKIQKVLSFQTWKERSAIRDVAMESILKELVKTFHASLLSVVRKQYKNVDFFEFSGHGANNGFEAEQDDCDNLFATNITSAQKEMLLEAYRGCFADCDGFREAILRLWDMSVLNKKFKLANSKNNSPYQDNILKIASERDLNIVDTVNECWREDIENLGLTLHPRQKFSGAKYTFYSNAAIKINGVLIPVFFSLHGTKDGEDLPCLQEMVSGNFPFKKALTVKKKIILDFISSDYLHIENIEDLTCLKFAYREGRTFTKHEVPRFNVQLEGELGESPIEELLFTQASFIQNLGMEVYTPVKYISDNRVFKESDAEYHFATALQYFMPYFEEEMGKRNIWTFNRFFLDGAGNPENLPVSNQLLGFRHLLIDEFQDISPQIVRWLLAIHRKLVASGIAPSIMAIGDDWQSIYGWRGSAPELFINFEKYFPISSELGRKPAIYRMMQNYRSVEPILKDAEKILEGVQNKIDKQAIAVRENDTGCQGIDVVTNIDFKKTSDIQTIVSRIIAEYHWVSSLNNPDQNKVMVMARTNKILNAVKKALGQQPGRYSGVKFLTFHQSKGLQAEVAILCGDCRYDLNHRFRNAVYKSSGLFSQTYDQAAKDEVFRLAYVAATRGIRRTIWFIDEFQNDGAAIRLKPSN